MWDSKLNNFATKLDFTHDINDQFLLHYGFSSTLHELNPAKLKWIGYQDFKLHKNYALEHGIHISNQTILTDKVNMQYGVRWSILQNMGSTTVYNFDKNHVATDSTSYKAGEIYNTYHLFEPRVGLAIQLNDQASLKASYAHNVQYIQLANSSSTGSPIDIWFLAGKNIKPQEADMVSAGYFQNLKDNMFETSVEVYYKNLKNVIDFKDHALLILNKQMEGEIRTGSGRAYGVEVMIRKNTGRLTGFANYTWSRSERTIPEINKGKTYLSPYDKTHSINIVLNYQASKKVSASAAWTYSTGTPSTYPSGRFEIDGEYYPIYAGRNTYRRPDYHRLDLSLNFIPNPDSKKRWKSEWNFSLYNAYGRHNPYVIRFDQEYVTRVPYAESTYLFSFVPSITYNFKF